MTQDEAHTQDEDVRREASGFVLVPTELIRAVINGGVTEPALMTYLVLLSETETGSIPLRDVADGRGVTEDVFQSHLDMLEAEGWVAWAECDGVKTLQIKAKPFAKDVPDPLETLLALAASR